MMLLKWRAGNLSHTENLLETPHPHSSPWPTRACRSWLCYPSSLISYHVSLQPTCSSYMLSFGFWSTTNFVTPLYVLFSVLECMFFHRIGVAGSSSCRFQLKHHDLQTSFSDHPIVSRCSMTYHFLFQPLVYIRLWPYNLYLFYASSLITCVLSCSPTGLWAL